MSNLRKAAQAALDALNEWPDMEGIDVDAMGRAVKAMDALCAALAQPEQPTSVAWTGDPSTQDYASTQSDQPTADAPTREDGLPNPVHLRRQQRKDGGYDMVPAYTTDEMRAFRAEGVAQERERCARVCEEVEDSAWALWKVTADPHEQGRSIGAQHCADAIRKG